MWSGFSLNYAILQCHQMICHWFLSDVATATIACLLIQLREVWVVGLCQWPKKWTSVANIVHLPDLELKMNNFYYFCSVEPITLNRIQVSEEKLKQGILFKFCILSSYYIIVIFLY